MPVSALLRLSPLIAFLLVTALVQPTAEAAPRRAATDACGLVLAKADGTAWACSFVDNFSSTRLDRTKWLPSSNFATGDATAFACTKDDTSVVRPRSGVLNLTVRAVPTPVTCRLNGRSASTNYISGGVSSYRLFSQQYGRFEARIRTSTTTTPGLHEAFWLWPDDRYSSTTVWPAAGEIDISETFSQYPTLSVPYLHYWFDDYGQIPGTNTAYDCTAYRGAWNTYVLEWSPSRLEIFVNGRSCLVNTSGDAAFQKPYIMALTQGLGYGTNALRDPSILPATMQVDYVKVWK